MFWFKRKLIVVDCFITHPTIEKFYPIQKASNFFPEGWKVLPKSKSIKVYAERNPASNLEVDMATAKKCIGLINLFSTGFIIPSWCDFGIEMDASGKHMYHSPFDLVVDQHPSWQLWDTLYDGYSHAKIGSPWILREKTGVKFSWHQCDWNDTENLDKFRILSGVIDYKHQHQTNVNMFIKKNSLVNFKAGQPLVHCIPISENDVTIKTHLIDMNEMIKLDYRPVQYMNQYNKIKKITEKESKCPFGFGK
jgi:hypothetical protein